MACGECGDPRNLCRCSIAPADSSVTITGTGDVADPFLISAPGAGAGTRDHDRAAIYDNELDGTYPLPLPPDYPHYAFYGPANPVDIPGYVPRQFDSWHEIVPGAPIALRSSGRIEAGAGSVLTITLPFDVRDGDVAVVTVGASTGSTPSAPPGWAQIITASGTFTGAWFKALKQADASTSHVFSGLVAPFGGYWQIYSGVNSQVLDAAGVATSSGSTAVASLTVPGFTTVTDGTLVLSAATINSPTVTLVAPAGMSTINASQGVAPRHILASQLVSAHGPVPARTWTHTPASPLRQYAGLQFALRPALVVTYHLWVDDRWVAVGGSGAGSSGSSGGFATTIGDGVHSTFTVVHPLASTDIRADAINLETGQICWPVIQVRGLDSVYLDFGGTIPASDSRRVLLNKVG